MPIYTTCAENREGAATDLMQWLCDERNRLIPGLAVEHHFLESIHDQFHRGRPLTPAQIEAVARWRRRAEREARRNGGPIPFAPVSEGSDPVNAGVRWLDEEDVAIGNAEVAAASSTRWIHPRGSAYEGLHDCDGRWGGEVQRRGATWREAQWVLAGEYKIRRRSLEDDQPVHRFRIHTITQAANTNLVGKRAVSVYMEDRWQSFAFVSVSGHLTLWSRFSEQAHEPFVLAAHALLEWFRDQDHNGDDDNPEDIPFIDPRGRGWLINWPVQYCRRCNQSGLVDDEPQTGIHDRDCTSEAASVFRRRPAPPVRDVLRPRASRPMTPAGSHAAPRSVTPVVELSELGTGWER